MMELFSCHVNKDGSISNKFPPFAKKMLLFNDIILMMHQKAHTQIPLVSKQN